MPAIAPPLVSQQLSALSAEQYPPDQQSVSVASAPQEPVYVSQLPDGQHVADAPGAVVKLAVESDETLTVAPVANEISAAIVLAVQVPEHPPVYAEVSESPESVITNVTVAARLLVADEAIEMPVLYEEHEEAHAPTAIP